jgi:hypothetical protein
MNPAEQPFKVVGPDYKPSPEEVMMMRRRISASKELRQQFFKKCDDIKKGIDELPTLKDKLAEFLTMYNLLHIAKPEPTDADYRPKTWKGKALWAAERFFKKIASWFRFREKEFISFKTQATSNPEASLRRTEDPPEGYAGTDRFLITCWDMIEETKDENLILMPGETKATAIRRVVNEYAKKLDKQDSPGFDPLTRGTDPIELDDGEAYEKLSMHKGNIADTETELSAAIRQAVGEGRPFDMDDFKAKRLAGKRVPESAPQGIIPPPPPVDPLLQAARDERLKELLAKESLSEVEKAQLDDLLRQGDVKVL